MAGTMKVLELKDTGSYVIYVVGKYGRPDCEWHVLFCEELMEFKCSCLRMESLGIPCEHIVAVLVFLDIYELPKSLVMDRWTKNAKASVHNISGSIWDSLKCSQYSCLIDWFRVLSSLSAGRSTRFIEMRDFAINTIARYKNEDVTESQVREEPVGSSNGVARNPRNCKTKGRSGERSKRKLQRCRVCRMEGHNRTTCPIRQDISQDVVTDRSRCLSLEDEGVDDTYEEESSAEMGDCFDEENDDYESFVDLASDV